MDKKKQPKVKKCLYLHPQTVVMVERRWQSSGLVNYSLIVNSVFEQMDFLLNDAKPVLSEKEWDVLCCLCQGLDLTYIKLPLDIAGHICTVYGITDIEGLPDNIRPLASKLSALPQISRLAVLEEVKKRNIAAKEDRR